MHAVEDKLSMGNVALNQTGELLVENGQAYLFINVNKIQIQNITAGLVNLYYLDEKIIYLLKQMTILFKLMRV